MSDPSEPPPKPIPLIVWAALGFVAVLAFALILRALNPADIGRAPATPDIVVPNAPKTAPIPEIEPVSPSP
jgi:hypothetical protein